MKFIVVLSSVLMCAVSTHAFRDSFVGAWSFDDGSGNRVSDISGNGNHGELIGGAEWEDGVFGKALHFDGSTGYVLIPASDSLDILNKGEGFTFAAWFLTDEIPGTNKEVFQQGDANGTGRTWFYINSSGVMQSYIGGSSTPSELRVVPGQWYHGAIVVKEQGDNDEIQIYIDGEPSGAPSNKSVEDSQGDFFIGCHKNKTNFWDGKIDEVALLNKPLTVDEIRRLMNEGIAGMLAVIPQAKLPVLWGKIKWKS